MLRAMNFSLNLSTPVLNRIVVSLIGALVLMFVVACFVREACGNERAMSGGGVRFSYLAEVGRTGLFAGTGEPVEQSTQR